MPTKEAVFTEEEIDLAERVVASHRLLNPAGGLSAKGLSLAGDMIGISGLMLTQASLAATDANDSELARLVAVAYCFTGLAERRFRKLTKQEGE